MTRMGRASGSGEAGASAAAVRGAQDPEACALNGRVPSAEALTAKMPMAEALTAEMPMAEALKPGTLSPGPSRYACGC